jgi:CheY-like chemotaxis protein
MLSALVIEDNRLVAESLIQMLHAINVNAQTALTPRSAILSLGDHVPDLIFLDIHLPGLDGFEILAYLHREPRFAKIKVVIVTSDDQPETYRRAKTNGAAAVIIKPVSIDSLEKALKGIGLVR